MGHLHLPEDHCCKVKKINDDLKWGPHLGGSHDDHVGVQEAAARANEHGGAMRLGKVHEGQKPAILKK